MKYLIVKCDELGDQWECDANRTPITMVENWEQWIKENSIDYQFEVYEFKNGKFNRIKEYDNPTEEGMSLHYWGEDEECGVDKPRVIYQYKNRTRDDDVPIEVQEYIKKATDEIDDSLENCGYIQFMIDDNYYVYGEYSDDYYTLGY